MDFAELRTELRDVLDSRYAYEQSFASKAATLVRTGTCGVCLTPTEFASVTSDGEKLPDGSAMPNWRESQFCGCRFVLNNRLRAMLHLLIGDFGGCSSLRLLLLGDAAQLRPALEEMSPSSAILVPNAIDRWRDRPSQSAHVILSSEDLHLHRDPVNLLKDACGILVPGGSLIFSCPFDVDSAGKSESIHEPGHPLGWEVFDWIDEAGFSNAEAKLYWSDEFGYLGAYNIVFIATR